MHATSRFLDTHSVDVDVVVVAVGVVASLQYTHSLNIFWKFWICFLENSLNSVYGLETALIAGAIGSKPSSSLTITSFRRFNFAASSFVAILGDIQIVRKPANRTTSSLTLQSRTIQMSYVLRELILGCRVTVIETCHAYKPVKTIWLRFPTSLIRRQVMKLFISGCGGENVYYV